jgi:SAM-dependent methyltransferase
VDEAAAYNLARWQALADAEALFTRPDWGLDAESARARLDPAGRLGDLTGKEVLCLAGGGGQQSAAFALLGARVTVLDLAPAQLERDQAVAAHYQVAITTRQGDMRDLSSFAPAAFDLVWHPYSLNFVPDVGVVFGEVARVLRSGGLYYLQCANPFFLGLDQRDWTGQGYALRDPYTDGAVIVSEDAEWTYNRAAHPDAPIPGPREYRHTLSTLLNGLIDHGFVLRHVADRLDIPADPSAPPGTWEHFTAVAPPWLAFWAARL